VLGVQHWQVGVRRIRLNDRDAASGERGIECPGQIGRIDDRRDDNADGGSNAGDLGRFPAAQRCYFGANDGS
jgi:hypothetical protein